MGLLSYRLVFYFGQVVVLEGRKEGHGKRGHSWDQSKVAPFRISRRVSGASGCHSGPAVQKGGIQSSQSRKKRTKIRKKKNI